MSSRLQERQEEEEGPLHVHYEVEYHKRSDHAVPSLNCHLDCKSDHSKFKQVDEFKLLDIPSEIRCEEVLKIIRLNIDLAVKVSVKRNTADGGDTGQDDHEGKSEADTNNLDTSGSGSICYFSDTHDMYSCGHGLDTETCNKCHIPDCPYNQELGPDHNLVTSLQKALSEEELSSSHIAFRVSTNQHVVTNQRDAANATVELFYHSEDGRSVVKARGVCLGEVWEDQDKVHLVCVTDLNQRVRDLLQTMSQKMRQSFASIPPEVKDTFSEKYVVVVSHPHGSPKVISVGTTEGCISKQCQDGRRYTETRYKAETCLGSSGAPVVGPGWQDGAPVYRVHCGYYTREAESRNFNKTGFSKSFWIIDSDPRGGAGPFVYPGPKRSLCRSLMAVLRELIYIYLQF